MGLERIFGTRTPQGIAFLMATSIVINLLQLILFYSGFDFITPIFGLNAILITKFYYFWQLFTYSFLHSPNYLPHLIFNMLYLYFIGSVLEKQWETKPFLKNYFFFTFTGAIGGLIFWSLGWAGPEAVGANGGIWGLLAVCLVNWPNRELNFWGVMPIKVKLIIPLLFILDFYGEMIRGNYNFGITVGGAIGGFLSYLYYTKLRYKFRINFPSFSFSRWRQKRKMVRWQEEMKTREEAKEEVDRLLEKISKEGMNSLNKKEKKFLKEASSKYYKVED
ncbi:rhomboid family intramembrane serine protease [Leptospira koniambonensis]|uniref:Rhomboid family intramembrane serine protease n=1 Tax=Leptospira koniambonensis TaxID=2484950 RepID=A0A4R9JBE6_9LEPT|nr:rhomboid family intramembrane serine protease [Leptospira koniambonensis]TGL35292.1 rhomboid family intramembrane serine protease [Leptospira koniambonensis]